MSKCVVVLGKPGTGKTQAAMRTVCEDPPIDIKGIEPKQTFYINPISKSLPNEDGYVEVHQRDNAWVGNLIKNHDPVAIRQWLEYANSMPWVKYVVIDDFQQIMAYDYLGRKDESGYEKYGHIGFNAANILSYTNQMRNDIVVFILSHTEETVDKGVKYLKFKTIGKMVDDTFDPAGMFTIILYSTVEWDLATNRPKYSFRTIRNSAEDIVRAPIGLFKNEKGGMAHSVPNDFGYIADRVREFYSIK